MTDERRWWCSWWCYDGDPRPVSVPVDARILGWWVSGERFDPPGYSMCAWVEAPDAAGVGELVAAFWPDWNREWRIAPAPKPNPPGDRFPLPNAPGKRT